MATGKQSLGTLALGFIDNDSNLFAGTRIGTSTPVGLGNEYGNTCNFRRRTVKANYAAKNRTNVLPGFTGKANGFIKHRGYRQI